MASAIKIGIVLLPLVIFLVFFARDVVENVGYAPSGTEVQADNLSSTADSSAW